MNFPDTPQQPQGMGGTPWKIIGKHGAKQTSIKKTTFSGKDILRKSTTVEQSFIDHLERLSVNDINQFSILMGKPLRPAQQEALKFLTRCHRDDYLIKILFMSRQQGKSVLLQMMAVLAALYPPKVKNQTDFQIMVCAQSKEKAKELIPPCQDFIRAVMTPDDRRDDPTYSAFSGDIVDDHILLVPNCWGGVSKIMFFGYPTDKKAGDPLRGFSPHLTFLDEAQNVDTSIINKVLVPFTTGSQVLGVSLMGLHYPSVNIVGTAPTQPERAEGFRKIKVLYDRDIEKGTNNEITALKIISFSECLSLNKRYVEKLMCDERSCIEYKSEIDHLGQWINLTEKVYMNTKANEPRVALTEFDCDIFVGGAGNPFEAGLLEHDVKLDKMTDEDRKTYTEFDPFSPVWFSMDIGVTETCVWFFQFRTKKWVAVNPYTNLREVQKEDYIVFLRCERIQKTNTNEVGDVFYRLQRKYGYIYGGGAFPHDTQRKVFTSMGSLVIEEFNSVGVYGWVCASTKDKRKVIQIQKTIRRCVFAEDGCRDGLRMLRSAQYNGERMKRGEFNHTIDALSLVDQGDISWLGYKTPLFKQSLSRNSYSHSRVVFDNFFPKLQKEWYDVGDRINVLDRKYEILMVPTRFTNLVGISALRRIFYMKPRGTRNGLWS